jgi:hypothetical protein
MDLFERTQQVQAQDHQDRLDSVRRRSEARRDQRQAFQTTIADCFTDVSWQDATIEYVWQERDLPDHVQAAIKGYHDYERARFGRQELVQGDFFAVLMVTVPRIAPHTWVICDLGNDTWYAWCFPQHERFFERLVMAPLALLESSMLRHMALNLVVA